MARTARVGMLKAIPLGARRRRKKRGVGHRRVQPRPQDVSCSKDGRSLRYGVSKRWSEDEKAGKLKFRHRGNDLPPRRRCDPRHRSGKLLSLDPERDLGIEFDKWEMPVVDARRPCSVRAPACSSAVMLPGVRRTSSGPSPTATQRRAISMHAHCQGAKHVTVRPPDHMTLDQPPKWASSEWSYPATTTTPPRARILPHVEPLVQRFEQIKRRSRARLQRRAQTAARKWSVASTAMSKPCSSPPSASSATPA